GQIFAAAGMVDLDHRAGVAQRLLLGDLLHRQDRPDWNIDRVAFLHDLELGHGPPPFFNRVEDGFEPRQPRRRRGVVRIGLPFRLADQLADRTPYGRLRDEVDVGIGIGLPALALDNPAGLPSAGVVAGTRRRFSEGNGLTVLAVLGKRAVSESLLVAQLDAREVEHAVLHGGEHLLTAARTFALHQRAHNAEGEMQTSARIAD